MHKKILSIFLVIAMIYTSGVAVFATESVENDKIDNNGLSLKETVTLMKTNSNAAREAILQKKSDEAVAKGYAETYSKIDKMLDEIRDTSSVTVDQISSQITGGSVPSYEYLPTELKPLATYITSQTNSQIASMIQSARDAGATNSNKNIMKIRKEFAKEHIDSNFQARMNNIEYDAIQLYYGVLLAKENVKVCEENVAAKNSILSKTEAMRRAGMCSDKEVYSAKASMETAKSELVAAKVNKNSTEMKFNYLLGRSILQQVTLLDSIEKLDMPSEAEEAYVEEAKSKRLEIDGSKYAVAIYEKLLDNVSAYPKSSSTYLLAKSNYDNAVYAMETAPIQIEIDIRTKYENLKALGEAVENAQKTYDHAKEGYRLTNLTYEVGMSTLADLQDIQATYHKAALALSAAIVTYDLAIYNFNYATDIGTTVLPL